MKNKRIKRGGRDFWDREYNKKDHLALSTNPSEDLIKFTHWLERAYGRTYLNQIASVADLGCGNGRNLVFLSRTYGLRGFGCDTSKEAITQAKQLSKDLPLEYVVSSIADTLPLSDQSQTIVLDMMASHFLNEKERKNLRDEIARILKPGGWLFLKTFLLDEDSHAKRLLRENPHSEPGTYIHPNIGLPEHVSTEEEIRENFQELFDIHKITKSFRHRAPGKARKRRSISLYAQKK